MDFHWFSSISRLSIVFGSTEAPGILPNPTPKLELDPGDPMGPKAAQIDSKELPQPALVRDLVDQR